MIYYYITVIKICQQIFSKIRWNRTAEDSGFLLFLFYMQNRMKKEKLEMLFVRNVLKSMDTKGWVAC